MVTRFPFGVMKMFYSYYGDECTTVKIPKVIPDAKCYIQDG